MDPMGHEIDSERFKKLRLNVSYSLSNLISSLGRVIDYYQSRNSDTPIERIFLIGLGADFSGLSKLLTNELNVKVVPLQQFDGIHVAKSINLAEAKLAEYFNCVGCSLSPLDILDSKKNKGIGAPIMAGTAAGAMPSGGAQAGMQGKPPVGPDGKPLPVPAGRKPKSLFLLQCSFSFLACVW